MEKLVVITSKFNIMTGNRNTLYSKNENIRKNSEWINYRMKIFMNFTAKSLINQSNQNFQALYVYEDTTEDLINKALSNYDKLPENISFIKKSQYNNRIENLASTVDILFLTRLDSDDMYVDEFVDKIYNYDISSGVEVILCRDGYVYDSVNGTFAEYSHESFTFYTFVYRLYEEEKIYQSLAITPWDLLVNFFHFSVLQYRYEVLKGRNYIFNIHGENTDSKFPKASFMWYKLGRFIEGSEKRDILSKFF